MFKILIVHTTRPGRSTGDRIRLEKTQELLQRERFQVFSVKIPLSADRNELFKAKYLEQLIEYSIPIHKWKFGLTISQKDLDYLLFNASLNYVRKIIRQLAPNVVLAQGTKAGWVASVASKEYKVPCIIDMHGLAFAEARGAGRKNWQGTLQQEFEAFRTCDYLVAVSKRMRDYVVQTMGIPNGKVVVAPNGSDLQISIASYGTPIKIVYAGGFAYWEHVDDYLDVAKHADGKRFAFYIAGDRSVGQALFERIRKEHIPITYLGYSQRPKIFDTLARMQVGIAPSTEDLARQVACPVKVFDYMAVGLPVITPRIGDWGDLIEDEDCGVALHNNNIEGYLSALDKISGESDWARKSKNARKIIRENYDWRTTLEPLLKVVRSYVE